MSEQEKLISKMKLGGRCPECGNYHKSLEIIDQIESKLTALQSAHDKLTKLCDGIFEHPYYQEHSGANYTCLFCNNYKGKPHADDCEVVKYKALSELTPEGLEMNDE